MSKPDNRAPLPPALGGPFLERVLHDLSQPLNQIRVAAQEVRIDARKGRLDAASVPSSMREIEAAVDEIVSAFDRLRRFSTPERGATFPRGGSLEPSVELAIVCESALDDARERFPEVTFVGVLDRAVRVSVPTALVIASALWETVLNAAQAAADAADARRVEVHLEAQEQGLVIRIRDTGRGVSPDATDALFDAFHTTRDDAAGLGLCLAHWAANQLGGRVRLTRTGDDGSEFELCLPAHPTGGPT